jgi:branched-chain amino acid transport system ATP-binding protein
MDGEFFEIRGLTKYFGGLAALVNLDMHVPKGQIRAIIGPNGAGKTTLLNLITRVYPSNSGEIWFERKAVHNIPIYAIAPLGISRTFQTVELFSSMTVLENVMSGFHVKSHAGLLSSCVRLRWVRTEEASIEEQAHKLINLVGLSEKCDDLANILPIGQQKRLEIARALASQPKILLLDEPAAGMNEKETEDLKQLIFNLRDRGLTVLLVEHDMKLVMNVADEITVLDYGNKIAEGTPEEIRHDEAVITAYFGSELGIF